MESDVTFCNIKHMRFRKCSDDKREELSTAVHDFFYFDTEILEQCFIYFLLKKKRKVPITCVWLFSWNGFIF